jgi:tRNA pseudouridine55 synthase
VDRVIVVRKPAGPTSHDVVERIRRSSGVRKVGHAGTLDPTATGVLVVMTGKATRLAQFLGEGTKEYRGHILLGRTTDSQDAAGRTLDERPWDDVTASDVERAFERLTGEIDQTPPMVSALKRDGTPLYELARAGVTVERAPRRVLVERLRLLAFRPPEVEFEVICSKGTYVRTLAADAGELLGCGACLGALERRRAGAFTLDEAVELSAVEALGRDIAVAGRSMFDALRDLPVLVVDRREALLIASGSALKVETGRAGAQGGLVRVTRDGVGLLAVCRSSQDGAAALVRPVCVFESVDGAASDADRA